MSCLDAVAHASDEELVKVHSEFKKWKHVWKQKGPARIKTDFGWALRHFDRCVCESMCVCASCSLIQTMIMFNRCHRAITRNCNSMTSRKSYARAIATTYVLNSKIYWKPHDDPCWKQVGRDAPPVPKNKALVRAFYNHNRDELYRLLQ
jgi:hypothetical protein